MTGARTRLRALAAVAWLALCVANAARTPRHQDVEPLFPERARDCAARHDAELAPLRAFVPSRAVVGYVGPRLEGECYPMFTAQYALTPAYFIELSATGRADTLEELGQHALAREPALVLAWGEPGRRWMDRRPDYRALVTLPRGDVVLVGRAP